MNIFAFALALEHTTELSQAETLLANYLSIFGIHSYAYTYYCGHIRTGQKLQYHCVSKALQAWHHHYLEQGYADVDRTLEDYYNNSLPCFWDVKIQLKQAKNKREQRIRLESIEFGISKGLSIPVHGPQGDFSSLTLHQRLDEECLAHYDDMQFEWMSAAQYFYHHVRRFLQSTHSKNKLAALTKRETQCLSYTAKSWRVEQIARVLKISTRTVNFHLQNANKKLGVHNKYEASYKLLFSYG